MNFDKHGGANYSRHRFAQELEKRGYDVTIYTLNFIDENYVPVHHDYDLEETQIDSATIVDGVYKFFRHIGRYFEKNDYVHAYVPGIIPLLGLYKRVTNDPTPVTATLNGYTPFCTNTALMENGCWANCSLSDKVKHSMMEPAGSFTPNSILRMSFNNFATVPLMNELDRYFCLSPSVRRIYREIGVNPDLLSVVPNMTDPHFVEDNTHLKHDDNDLLHVLYVGRVDAMKSISSLLDAVASMRSDPKSYQVDIVGDNILGYGQSLSDYRNDAISLGIDDRVTFHGWVDYTELSDYYKRGDIFVHPAKWPEPFGRTIIEAMDHGLPVICSNVGAPPWIAGSAGITYARDNPIELAKILDTMVKAPERVHAMAANTDTELKRFRPGPIMDTVEQILQEVSK